MSPSEPLIPLSDSVTATNVVPPRGSLANRLCTVAAGCAVDEEAVRKRQIDLASLRKLGEAYRAGWLHNIMGRITPLTMRRSGDYVAMADLFVTTPIDAERLLERFVQDLEIYCASIGVQVGPQTTAENAAPEVKQHLGLYQDIAKIFERKFAVAAPNPVAVLGGQAAAAEIEMNPFLREFVSTKFGDK